MKKFLTAKTLGLFFKALAEEWPHPAEILLLGGAAGLVVGNNRPTRDVDFEVSFASKRAGRKRFQSAVRRATERTGIDAQFSENVARWSMISFLDYSKHRKPFKRYGKIRVSFLDPPYWSIGKVSRYWDQDIRDMIFVFSKVPVDPVRLARLWERALKESPLSDRLFGVKTQMCNFFKTYGRKIWGRSCPLEKILPLFQ